MPRDGASERGEPSGRQAPSARSSNRQSGRGRGDDGWKAVGAAYVRTLVARRRLCDMRRVKFMVIRYRLPTHGPGQ
jgi:hypothetical protein